MDAVNPQTNMIYVTSESTDKVHVIDGNTNSLVTIIDVEKSPRGVAVNSESNTIYVTNQASDNISVIDGFKNTVVDTIAVGDTPRHITVNPETNTLYVTNQFSETVSVIDGSRNMVVDTISVNNPFDIAINPSTNKVYVTYFETGILFIITDSIKVQPSSVLSLPTIIGIVAAVVLTSVLAAKFVRKKQLKT